MGFIPEEFFQFFYPKTGLCGPYLFMGGLLTTLLSKELLVIEHEFVTGVVLFGMFGLVQKLYGKDIGEYIDKEIEKEHHEECSFVEDAKTELKELIEGNWRVKETREEVWIFNCLHDRFRILDYVHWRLSLPLDSGKSFNFVYSPTFRGRVAPETNRMSKHDFRR